MSHTGKALRIAIVRPYAMPLDTNFYNCQELGLGGALARVGCDVDVFVVGNRSSEQNIEHGGSQKGRLRLIEETFFKVPEIQQAIIPRIRKALRVGNYDLIHTNESNELESWLISRTARQLGKPLVLYQGMYEPISGRIQKLFQKVFDRFCLPQLRRFTTYSLAKTSRAASLMRQRGFTDVKVLPVGLDTTTFQTQIDWDWRAELGIPEDAFVVLYVGVLEPRRNTKLIASLAEYFKNSKIWFVVAGVGPESEIIEFACKTAHNLKYLGRVPQTKVAALYSQANCFILPSNYEIYGMVVLESMYFGLPVIATRTAGPEDLIDNNVSGLLVDSLDLHEWAGAIKNLAANSECQSTLSHNASDKVQQELTWDAVANRYYQIAIEADN